MSFNSKRGVHLSTLASYSLADFPEAFESIRNPDLYKFESTEIISRDGTSDLTELLRISYGDSSSAIAPLWAGVQNGSLVYYAGYSLTGVRAIILQSLDGSEIPNLLSPFRFIAGSGSLFIGDYTEALLEGLAKFAFLLAGRTDQIEFTLSTPAGLRSYQFVAFRTACEQIHENMQNFIRENIKNDSTPVDLLPPDGAESELTSAAHDICDMDAEAEVQGRGARTSTVNSVFKEESLDTDEDQGTYSLSSIAEILTVSTETSAPKPQKHSHTQSNIPTASISAKTPAPSDEIQALLNAVGEQYKKELQDDWTRQKKALRRGKYTLKKRLEDCTKRLHNIKTKLHGTEKKLSEKEQECEEWKAKFLKLQAGVGDLMNID